MLRTACALALVLVACRTPERSTPVRAADGAPAPASPDASAPSVTRPAPARFAFPTVVKKTHTYTLGADEALVDYAVTGRPGTSVSHAIAAALPSLDRETLRDLEPEWSRDRTVFFVHARRAPHGTIVATFSRDGTLIRKDEADEAFPFGAHGLVLLRGTSLLRVDASGTEPPQRAHARPKLRCHVRDCDARSFFAFDDALDYGLSTESGTEIYGYFEVERMALATGKATRLVPQSEASLAGLTADGRMCRWRPAPELGKPDAGGSLPPYELSCARSPWETFERIFVTKVGAGPVASSGDTLVVSVDGAVTLLHLPSGERGSEPLEPKDYRSFIPRVDGRGFFRGTDGGEWMLYDVEANQRSVVTVDTTRAPHVAPFSSITPALLAKDAIQDQRYGPPVRAALRTLTFVD